MKKQERNWLDVLRGVRQGSREKIFIQGEGIKAEIGYELNGIIEINQNQVTLLKKADEANKQILTSLSHDVRTPLTSLLGYLEVLNEGVSERNEEKEYLSVAYRKANDLKSYIDMLFEWFKLNSNEQQFYFESIDINELTREIIIEWLPVFEQSQTSLSINIKDDDLMVSLDKMAYKRVLNNLIQNAIKHGGCTRLSIAINSCTESVMIEVANNGENIPSHQLPFIFERLYKGDSARSDKGSGLGLAITKELVTVMNGEISVSSQKNEDTVFSITLPISK